MTNTTINLKLKKPNVAREVITYKGIDIHLILANTVTIRADLEIDGTWHKTDGEFTAKILIDKLLKG